MVVVILVFASVLSLAWGVALVHANRTSWIRRKRVLATPTTKIADAKGGVIEITGTITDSAGLVTAPFSKRKVAWYRATVQELRSAGKRAYWHTIAESIDAREIFVEDGSGEAARVQPLGAEVLLDPSTPHVTISKAFVDPPPHIEAFLRARDIEPKSWLGLNKSMRFEERVLAVGDPLYALGPSRREPGVPGTVGYRSGHTTQLVLEDGETELLLATEPELRLRFLLGAPYVAGVALTILGVLGFLVAYVVY